MVLQDHRLRRRAARVRPAAGRRLARAHEGDPAQLDRPLRGRRAPVPDRGARPGHPGLHDAARHGVRRDVLRARARASARAASSSRARRTRRRRWRTSAGLLRPGPTSAPAAEEKTGVFTGRLRDEPGHRRAHPDLGRRLRADGLRHRRDHGGAGPRRARPASSRRRSTCRSSPVIDEDERLVNSGQFDGLPAAEAKRAIVDWLDEQGRGAPAVSFRLRDWGFSRQRYWGCPIPIVYCDDCGLVPVPDDELPVLLPDVEDYRPKGQPPLASNEDWVRVPCPRCGKEGRREADTMDTFVDSSWYFLRYCRSAQRRGAVRRARSSTTGCRSTQYIGGIDHATGHLLYSRFFVKVLNDLGMVGFREPFARPVPPGLGAAGRHEDVEVEGQRHRAGRAARGVRRRRRCASTSCSWGRPTRTWSGPSRHRGDVALRAAALADRAGSRRRSADRRRTHRPAGAESARDDRRVTDDIERRFQFNTPIAAVMELVNEINRAPATPPRVSPPRPPSA